MFTEKFDENMKVMEHRYGAKDFVTSADMSLLAPGTYYPTNVDSMYRQYYAKKAVDSVNSTTAVKGEALINGHSWMEKLGWSKAVDLASNGI